MSEISPFVSLLNSEQEVHLPSIFVHPPNTNQQQQPTTEFQLKTNSMRVNLNSELNSARSSYWKAEQSKLDAEIGPLDLETKHKENEKIPTPLKKTSDRRSSITRTPFRPFFLENTGACLFMGCNSDNSSKVLSSKTVQRVAKRLSLAATANVDNVTPQVRTVAPPASNSRTKLQFTPNAVARTPDFGKAMRSL
eukprot:GHVL01023633.1.p1 GENE.GHVL01023633.1~~GHVL01023633.1.p1  ORF type:complete len:221 (+),score=33.57 GHVL01023633.1:84-665(+)